MTNPKANRVTTTHLSYLATGPYQAGQRCTALVDTDDSGIQLLSSDAVLAPASSVRRLLLTRVDLLDGAAATNSTLSAYVTSYGGQIAADLNALLALDKR